MKKFLYGTLFLFVFFFSAYTLAQENTPEANQRYVSDEVIVKFKSNINLQKSSGIKSMQKFASQQNLRSEEVISTQNISVMKITDGQTVLETIQDIQQDPTIEYVQPNFIYTLQASDPNDTYFNIQR